VGTRRLPLLLCPACGRGCRQQPPRVREAQAQALKVPNTAMAVAMDIGEKTNVHPKNKQDLCERLARIARANVYGEKIEYYGPMYDSIEVEGQSIRVGFTHVGGGLVAKGGDLKWFQNRRRGQELRGCGREDRWPYGCGDRPRVPVPVAVRYAWESLAGRRESLQHRRLAGAAVPIDDWATPAPAAAAAGGRGPIR